MLNFTTVILQFYYSTTQSVLSFLSCVGLSCDGGMDYVNRIAQRGQVGQIEVNTQLLFSSCAEKEKEMNKEEVDCILNILF